MVEILTMRLESKLEVHDYLCCDMHVRSGLIYISLVKIRENISKWNLFFLLGWWKRALRLWSEERSFWKGWALVGGASESPLYYSDQKQER